MDRFATMVLLLTAVALPALLFLLFRPRSRLTALAAALVAIAAGWSFNVSCIVATEAIAAVKSAQVEKSSIAVAVNFGWICPLVIVLLSAIVWSFATRRSSSRLHHGSI